ncbi:MAG: OB-fold nucleic acid binding domain-containing protein, partial [Polyangiaceae bacterium]|nr:OB-fold nucleic acid binding domain-containing protein [Polyangiaceae bacterium]
MSDAKNQPSSPSDAVSKSDEESLIQVRRDKAAKIRERGAHPFANDVARDERIFIGDLRRKFDVAMGEDGQYQAEAVDANAAGERFTVFGRLIARRGFGKASFLRLRDGSGEIQLFAKKDILGEDFAALKEIDLADHIEAKGRAMLTKTGELSLELSHLRLVTKSLRPPADKWHGLADVDLRYRRRYVDMVANPEVAQVIAARAIVLGAIRKYLDQRHFLEVETPSLHPLIGGASARPFATHHN